MKRRSGSTKAQKRGGGKSDFDKRRKANLKARGASRDKAGPGSNKRCQAKMKLFFRKLGCGKFEKIPLTGTAAELAMHLKFTSKELNSFQLAFDSIDLDGTREIDYDEMLEMLEEKRSPYTDALFALVDDDASGVIDIQKFFRLVAMYSMYKQGDIEEYVFQTFDKDGSGQIDEDEFLDLARTVNNAEPLFPGNFQTALEQFDQNEDGMLDFREFKEICAQFPMVFYPAFRLQDKMHKAVLGRRFWEAVMRFLHDRQEEEEYALTHDGHRRPVACFERFQQKMFCLFECCRGPRWRAGWDASFGADFSHTGEANGVAVALRKRRKKGQQPRSKQRTKDRQSGGGGGGVAKSSSFKPQPTKPGDAGRVLPVKALTKREKDMMIEDQRITVRHNPSERRRAW